jgi:hypothetical protein
MKTVPISILLAVFAVAGSLHAAEAPEEPAATPVPATESAQDTKANEQTEADSKADEQAAEAKQQEKSSADEKSSPQRFIPSEQVRADFDVSFPIDI